MFPELFVLGDATRAVRANENLPNDSLIHRSTFDAAISKMALIGRVNWSFV